MRYSVLLLSAGLLWSGCRGANEQPAQRAKASLDSAKTEPAGPEASGPAISLPRVTATIRQGISIGRANELDRSYLGPDRNGLNRLYGNPTSPLWVGVSGKPTPAARDAIAAMHTALEDGLDTLDYSPGRLELLADKIDSSRAPDPVQVGRFDLALSTAFLRYVADLHAGRIDPRSIGFNLDLPLVRKDVPALIRSALAEGTIAHLVLTTRPPLVQYQRVKEALAHYRELADSVSPLVPNVTGNLRPGATWVGLGPLSQRLRLLGDLRDTSLEAGATDTTRDATARSDVVEVRPPGELTIGTSGKYEGPIVEAVKRFQERHGLAADGVIGKNTVAALNVPIRQRVAQLELTLERLRWIPDLSGERFVLVNIPTFHLWAWDSLDAEGTPSLDMDVIVGQRTVGEETLDRQTPVFAEQMRYVIFRPYWNVPPSIVQNEVLPGITQDSTYLQRNDMEIVQGQGDDAKPVAMSPENLELLAKGQLRVRQRPGPRNSLGLVKFMFPNDENVYLHGTPAQELFARTKRDFSHGCVRVERPVDLAEWVLHGQPGWTRDSIVETMQAGKPVRVNLKQPLPVILFYTTAMVGMDGTPLFFEDLYGHDEMLLKALGTRSR